MKQSVYSHWWNLFLVTFRLSWNGSLVLEKLKSSVSSLCNRCNGNLIQKGGQENSWQTYFSTSPLSKIAFFALVHILNGISAQIHLWKRQTLTGPLVYTALVIESHRPRALFSAFLPPHKSLLNTSFTGKSLVTHLKCILPFLSEPIKPYWITKLP